MEERPCEERIEQLFREIENRFGSLEAFADSANVPVSFLEALRDGRWDELPEAVYVRAFLKKVAKVLGWDEEELVSIFSDCVCKRQVSTEIEGVPVKRSGGLGLFGRGGWIFLIAVLFFLVGGLVYTYVSSLPKEPVLERVERPKTEPVPPSGNLSEPSLDYKYEVKLFSAKGKSWYRWVSPGFREQGFILPEGNKTFECSANSTCYLKLGKPEVVEIKFNDKLWHFKGTKPILLRFANGTIEIVRGGL